MCCVWPNLIGSDIYHGTFCTAFERGIMGDRVPVQCLYVRSTRQVFSWPVSIRLIVLSSGSHQLESGINQRNQTMDLLLVVTFSPHFPASVKDHILPVEFQQLPGYRGENFLNQKPSGFLRRRTRTSCHVLFARKHSHQKQEVERGA